jgi:hypothetical protein
MALNECSEWGRIALLSTLARYKAQDVEESEHICERVLPQFQHVNAAVVLGAVKVIMIHMKNVHREDLLKQLTRKMAPPLGQRRVFLSHWDKADDQSPLSRLHQRFSGSLYEISTCFCKSAQTSSQTR